MKLQAPLNIVAVDKREAQGALVNGLGNGKNIRDRRAFADERDQQRASSEMQGDCCGRCLGFNRFGDLESMFAMQELSVMLSTS